MTCFKKLWALLLAAGMALTLFAGCCSPSLLRLLLDLLQDQYQNITVTAEDDLETALRQAVSQNDTMEEITAALAQALDKTVEFQSLRSARAGDQTFSLVFQTGSDTEAIARQTYTDWNKVLGSLPSSGQYLADLATLKADGGYYILVNVTVKRGGSSGSSDDGSGSGDENDGGGTTNPQKDYDWIGTDVILVHTNTGLQNVFFDDMSGSDRQLMDARAAGFEDITIKLEKNDYVVNQTFKSNFKGVLTSENDKAIINISGSPMFLWSYGDILNVDFNVTETIQGDVVVGAVACMSFGTIDDCDVTFENGCGIEVYKSSINAGFVAIGGVVGYQYGGAIIDCSVTDGAITADVEDDSNSFAFSVGGIVGYDGTKSNDISAVTGCEVDGINIQAQAVGFATAGVGGIAGISTANSLLGNFPDSIVVNNNTVSVDEGGDYNQTGSIAVGKVVGRKSSI